jgi:hypothetical protein
MPRPHCAPPESGPEESANGFPFCSGPGAAHPHQHFSGFEQSGFIVADTPGESQFHSRACRSTFELLVHLAYQRFSFVQEAVQVIGDFTD